MLFVMCLLSPVMCKLSPVICHVSNVTCILSLTPTAIATDPPPAFSATMQIRLVRKDQKKTKKKKEKKNHQNLLTSRGMPLLAIHTLNRSFKIKLFGPNWQLCAMVTDRTTDIGTARQNWPWRWFSENVIKTNTPCWHLWGGGCFPQLNHSDNDSRYLLIMKQ